MRQGIINHVSFGKSRLTSATMRRLAAPSIRSPGWLSAGMVVCVISFLISWFFFSSAQQGRGIRARSLARVTTAQVSVCGFCPKLIQSPVQLDTFFYDGIMMCRGSAG